MAAADNRQRDEDMERQYQEELKAYEQELHRQAMRQRALEEAHRPQQQTAPPPADRQVTARLPNPEANQLWHHHDLQRQTRQLQKHLVQQAPPEQQAMPQPQLPQQPQQQRPSSYQMYQAAPPEPVPATLTLQQSQQSLPHQKALDVRTQAQLDADQVQPPQETAWTTQEALRLDQQPAASAPPNTSQVANQHVKDYMRSLMGPTGAAPWPYNQPAKQAEQQDNLRDRQTAKGGESFGRVSHASNNRMFAMEAVDGADEPLAVVGGNLGTFDAESLRHLPARSQATLSPQDEASIPPAGRALRRDGGTLAWQAGKQTSAEVWAVDEPDANYSSTRYYGRTGSHKTFLDPGRPQVVGGNWHGPSAAARQQMITPRNDAASRSPAVTPTDEVDGKQFGRCQTAWDDRNTDGDFRVLGGGWVSEVDEQRQLPPKPTQFSPPSTAYSDVDNDSTPVGARGPKAAASRTHVADHARAGSAMSEVLGLGGAFDLRASKGAPSWADIKKNQPQYAKLPYGQDDEHLQPPRFARRPSLAMEEKRLQQESEISILGAVGGWMGPSTSNLASSATDAERDSLVARNRRTRRPLSAKPNEMRMRQSAVVREEEALHERAVEREANTRRHRGECPWM